MQETGQESAKVASIAGLSAPMASRAKAKAGSARGQAERIAVVVPVAVAVTVFMSWSSCRHATVVLSSSILHVLVAVVLSSSC